LRKDHRPFYFKKSIISFQDFYTRRFIEPQFDRLGKGFSFVKPWHVKIYGSPIELGNYVNVIADSDMKVRLTVWSEISGKGRIQIGNYCLICPGVRISSADEITIGDNCMMASRVYITDSDWHDTYDRVAPFGKMSPIKLESNVWLGDSALICKGVTIGENSIIGAGSVVVNDIPANSIAAGNPAKVVKKLDTTKKMITRDQYYAFMHSFPSALRDHNNREKLKGNTICGWLRSMLNPRKSD
jgi:acetyltransferase-like isoleucine patch superfamily enzyme